MGKIYKNENQILLNELITMYKPNNYDWLHYQITKKNKLTLHHIKKQCDGGGLFVDNSALLTKKSHRNLHICENKDIILYDEINDFFEEIIFRKELNDYLINESIKYKDALLKVLYK